MVFKHYGKFIRNRTHRNGGKFLEGMREADEAVVSAEDSGECPGKG